MANPAAGNMTGMAGYTNQDLLKQQADRAGERSVLTPYFVTVCLCQAVQAVTAPLL
jgi:hypothetical protein